MARTGNNKKAAHLVHRLTEIGATMLARDLGIEQAAGETVMRDIAHALATEAGGSYVYVPKDREFQLLKRDLEIWHAHTGNNVPELARAHGISETQVYNILAHMRREMKARTQPQLPGFDPETDRAA